MIREGYDAMTEIGDRSFASTVAVGLGDAYLSLDQDDEAWRFGTIARDTSSSDDVVSQAGGRAIQARVLSRRADRTKAESLAREAVAIMAQTDYIDQHAGTIVHLAHVLQEAGKTAEALAAARRRRPLRAEGRDVLRRADPATDRRVGLLMAYPGRLCARCGNENPAEARFCFSCGAALEASAPAAETRKTVTVLFCDLVGSTALGERLDPETLRGLLGRSFDRVSAIVEGHGGVVEKFIGDAAMAVFGIPRVHEDDALRAVRRGGDPRSAEAAAGAAGGATVAWRTGSRPARWWRVIRRPASGWSPGTR